MDIRREINTKSDEELVSLILKNQDYFLYLMERYENRLLAYILKISNAGYEEARDTLQEVFIKVYQNLNDFDRNLKFSSWIYRITHNQVISNYRKKQARPPQFSLAVDEGGLENLASDLDLKRELDLEFLKKRVYQILDRINMKYREVLVLKFLEEKNYREISDIIKKPMGTVATLINRAKKEFIKELKRQNIKLE